MRIKILLSVLAAMSLIAASCGDDDATEGTRRVEIEATDFAFSPDLISLSAGQVVEFVVTNIGAVDHEFRVTNQAEVDAHIAGGHEEHMGGDEMGEMDEGEMEDMGTEETPMLMIPPGETMTLTVTIPDDPALFTLFVCLIPGHYEAGMVGEFVNSG